MSSSERPGNEYRSLVSLRNQISSLGDSLKERADDLPSEGYPSEIIFELDFLRASLEAPQAFSQAALDAINARIVEIEPDLIKRVKLEQYEEMAIGLVIQEEGIPSTQEVRQQLLTRVLQVIRFRQLDYSDFETVSQEAVVLTDRLSACSGLAVPSSLLTNELELLEQKLLEVIPPDEWEDHWSTLYLENILEEDLEEIRILSLDLGILDVGLAKDITDEATRESLIAAWQQMGPQDRCWILDGSSPGTILARVMGKALDEEMERLAAFLHGAANNAY